MWMPGKELLSGENRGKGGKKQIWGSSEMIQRSAGWAWLSGRAMCTHSHPPPQFWLSSSMMKIFIPFPFFFIFFPGKDEVLMRWISVLPLKSSVIQLKGVNHLSRQDVFPLFSLSYIITSQMSFPLSCSFWDPADVTVGWQRHSWAQLGIPSRGATMNMCP